MLLWYSESHRLKQAVSVFSHISMPDKPIWYARLDDAIRRLEALPFPWVDRAALEFTLGIGRRRAQQILQPLVRRTIGKNGLADRDELIRHLRELAAGQTVSFEIQRRD